MASRNSILTFILILSINICSFSQEVAHVTNAHKFKQLGLVWGLMKYHHSEVSRGKYNWDEIFIKNAAKVESVNTQKELNAFLLNFISSVKESKIKRVKDLENLFEENYDYDWIESYASEKKLYESLKNLRDNTNIKDYYVSFGALSNIPSFENEKGYQRFDFREKTHRLLTLFSFWNVIQYNYVNKYLLDVNWFDQLDAFIEAFMNSKTELDYEVLKSKLIATIRDSHTVLSSQLVFRSMFKYKPVFGIRLVNDTLLVSAIFNKTLSEKDDVRMNDLIVEIEGMSIDTYLQNKIGLYFPSSNISFLKKWAKWILMSPKNTINLKIKRENEILIRDIRLYDTIRMEDYSTIKSRSVIKDKWKFLENKIGYIKLDSINKRELKEAFSDFRDTEGIIIDLRNYPKFIGPEDLASHLYPDKKTFLKVLMPMKNRPSLGVFNDLPLSFVVKPFNIGKKNNNYYQNRIVLLVNKTTISKAEFIGMAIQASPNCITLGEQTAGAVMNIAEFSLPDNTQVTFTTMGAFYPDGTGTQKEGLKIDYQVKENTINYLTDQFIAQGIELINSNKVIDN